MKFRFRKTKRGVRSRSVQLHQTSEVWFAVPAPRPRISPPVEMITRLRLLIILPGKEEILRPPASPSFLFLLSSTRRYLVLLSLSVPK